MSWFKNADICQGSPDQAVPAFALASPGATKVLSADNVESVEQIIGELPENGSVYFMTKGAWSNIRLIEYLLQHSGPAEVFLSTWSISEEAIRRLVSWQESGMITALSIVLDEGVRNRKPEICQQAIAAFPELKFAKCHAKVAVIMGAQRVFTLMGSANFTRNPRRETGMIITDIEVARANAEWIREEVQDDRS